MSTSGTQSVVFRSEDNGESWATVEGPAGIVFPGGDPMLAFVGDGTAYFSTITPEIRVFGMVAYTTITSPVGRLLIAASERGLRVIETERPRHAALRDASWVER